MAGRREVGVDHERTEAIERNWKFDKVELCRDEGPFFSRFGAQPVYDLMLAEWLQGVASGKVSGEAGRWEGGRGRRQGGGARGGKVREVGGGGMARQGTQLCLMCIGLGPWAQDSSQGSYPIILAQGVQGGPGTAFKQDSMDGRQRSSL